MKRIFNWGILGAGSIAGKFASDLKLLPNANLYAVGSRSYKRAKEFVIEHGGIPYGSYKELVADPEVDIIYIASRHIAHYPDTILSLKNGKAVLCEKPVAMNQAQFERMVKLAAEKKLFFMEALWTNFTPSFLKVRELISSGEIGEISLIESDFCFKSPYDVKGRVFNRELGGGVLLDVGLYPVFLALELGGDVSEIEAMAKFDRTGVDNMCNILLKHESGVMSVLSSSMVTNGRVESLIHGTKGIIRLNKWWHTPTSIDLIPDDEEAIHIDFEEKGFGYQYEAEEVMACLHRGDIESARFSWEHSRRLISVLDNIRSIAGIKYSDQIEGV